MYMLKKKEKMTTSRTGAAGFEMRTSSSWLQLVPGTDDDGLSGWTPVTHVGDPEPGSCPGIMALGLLWLGLILLGALHTQAQELTRNPTPSSRLIPVPSLHKIQVQKNFQSDQFQGKWYVVGLAGNNIHNGDQEYQQMYSTTYELKEDGSYNVTSTVLRNQQCDHWVRTFVPGSKPGHFNLGNIKSYPTLKSYLVRVVNTDYNQSAIVFFRKVHKNKKKFFKIVLYGRTKELSPEHRGRFSSFAKSLGLTDNHIVFPAPIGQCIDD